MLPDLIPAEAVLPNLELDATALALRDELAARVMAPDVPPLEINAFLHRLLTAFCQDGTPRGLALQPPAQQPRPRPGQTRRAPEDAWQPRAVIAEPLCCALARRLVDLSARAQPGRAAELALAHAVLDQVSAALAALAQEGRWASLLLTRPRGSDNRLFDLHYRTAGYPAWDHLALRLHAGLVAQIGKEAVKPPATRDHNIAAYCTAPTALVPLIPAETLVPALAFLDEDDQPLRDVLWAAAARLQGLKGETRQDYVDRLLDMLRRGAATRAPQARPSGFRRPRRPAPFTLAELDPEAAPEDIPDRDRWHQLVSQTARDEDLPGLEVDPAQDDEELDYETGPTDPTGRDAARPPPPHLWGPCLALDRHPSPAQPHILQLAELAVCYQATRPAPTAAPAVRLSQATRFLLLDLLIHTGRPPEWWAAVHVGVAPDPDQTLAGPVYDPERGAIYYPPGCTVGIPPRLQGPDEAARRERAAQAEAYEPVRPWCILPLTPRQNALLHAYRQRQAEALATRPAPAGPGPLLQRVDGERWRPWAPADTVALSQDLTAALRARYPGAPAVQPGRLRATFTAWYRHLGLDPVYALWVSEHYRPELQMPVIYSRVQVGLLAQAYAAAQAELRAAIEAEYRRLPNGSDAGRPDPVLWQPASPPLGGPWSAADTFGSWRCPRRERLRALFAGLRQLAAAAEPASAQRGRGVWLAVSLTLLTGLRPAEVCQLRAHWVDLTSGVIAVDGKDNYALTADRLVPIPAALRPALAAAVAASAAGPLPPDGRGLYLLWLDQGVPTPLSLGLVERLLVEAGEQAGLSAEQVPDWYSLRHYWRSRALAAGLPFEVINVLLGHQVLGCDLYNRARNQELRLALAAGRALADQIAAEIGVGGEPD